MVTLVLNGDIIDSFVAPELTGPAAFQMASTRRQFQRYAEKWRNRDEDPRSQTWRDIAGAAVTASTPA